VRIEARLALQLLRAFATKGDVSGIVLRLEDILGAVAEGMIDSFDRL
jgi:hypothetical protein